MENSDTAGTTVNQVLDLYRQDCFEALAPRTRKDYVRHIALLRAKWGERCVDDMRPKEFAAFIHQRKDGKVQRVRQLAVLSSAFSQAVSTYGIVARNPLRDVKKPRFKPRDRLISDTEFHALLRLAPAPIRLGILLALKTGQRQGDILNFKWSDLVELVVDVETEREIEYEGETVLVRMVRRVKMWHLNVLQGKTGKRIAIPVDAELESVLDECYLRRKYNCEYVLGSRNGRAYVAEGYRAQWQRVRCAFEAEGNKNLHFHDIRALAATRCRTLEEAQALLGHDSSTITKKVYRRGIEVVPRLPSMPVRTSVPHG